MRCAKLRSGFELRTATTTNMLEVFFIGDESDGHFRDTVLWLRSNMALRVLTDIGGAVRCVRDAAACPAVIILGQSRRGQFAESDVERLLHAAPLARVVVLAGSWCEGETRSGRPIGGVHRLTWHEAPQAVPRELAALSAGRTSGWSWPATAVRYERPLPTNRGGQLVAVCSASASMAEAVSFALRDVGYKTAIAETSRPNLVLGAGAIVWDVPADADRVDLERRALRDWFAGVPVVALCGFPRPDDLTRLRSMGVSAAVGKPFQLADLAAAVERAIAEYQVQLPQAIAAA